ncbi:unnamed protein product [Amoebophrya sp. A25]|nr:unnamed protein product [Amoebophrya sp. A25]|eukprot:GSA25T00006136001.1
MIDDADMASSVQGGSSGVPTLVRRRKHGSTSSLDDAGGGGGEDSGGGSTSKNASQRVAQEIMRTTSPSSSLSQTMQDLALLHILLDHSAAYFSDWRVGEKEKHCWSLLGTVLTPDIVRQAVAFVIVSAAFAIFPVVIEGGISGGT